MGMDVRVASPQGYYPDSQIVETAKTLAASHGGSISITEDPTSAIAGAHALYTDVWASMGQEDLAEARMPIFQPYQLNTDVLKKADADAIVLHCLPAHRGEEITEEVIEGKQSRVWDQAENRMHAQKALLASVLGIV